MIRGSWIITNKETGEAIIEIFDEALLPLINTEKYQIETARVYLGRLNSKINEEPK